MQEKIIILDFGSQYTQLIGRRLRELNVYSEIYPYNKLPEISTHIKGLILSGSPCSVNDENPPIPEFDKFLKNIPVLGICYGAQLLTQYWGGNVGKSYTREYGRAHINIVEPGKLFEHISVRNQVWMSHSDTIISTPDDFEVQSSTDSIPVAAFKVKNYDIYGIQFHPEVTHTTEGIHILRNFAFHICGCSGNWTPDHFVKSSIKSMKEQLGNDEVVIGLSGGVDSSVAAMILHQAIGKRLTCLFIDNGLLRKSEYNDVMDSYRDLGLKVVGVPAAAEFYTALYGIVDPESKRKAIGRVFIEIFEKEALKLNQVKWLAQGTIYPDVIESVSVKGPSVTIKSHHNVGGLPDRMNLKIVEPLRMLFKDEVRRAGTVLGLPDYILQRHPFPGPGLAIRIIGEVTRERIEILQEADSIFISALKENGLYNSVWQAGAIFLPIKSVGVMGDERTYENVVCLRAVTSVDGMTADWSQLPHDFLATVSNNIINKVKGINRVVYDISSKPPATIEWE